MAVGGDCSVRKAEIEKEKVGGGVVVERKELVAVAMTFSAIYAGKRPRGESGGGNRDASSVVLRANGLVGYES